MAPAAGQRGSPLPRKLGIVEESRLCLLDAPPGFLGLLEPLPAGVTLHARPRRPLDVVVYFVVERRRLARRVENLGRAIFPAGALWVAWPKRASGVSTDMGEDVVREVSSLSASSTTRLPPSTRPGRVCASYGGAS